MLRLPGAIPRAITGESRVQNKHLGMSVRCQDLLRINSARMNRMVPELLIVTGAPAATPLQIRSPIQPKLKPRWDVHISGDDDQLGCAGESLSSVLGERPGSVV